MLRRTRRGSRGRAQHVLVPGIVAASLTTGGHAEEISFGAYQLYDFGELFPETRYGWSSGDALIAELDLNTRIGSISGKKRAQITPAVKAWGVTIVPAIFADTRTGARLTADLEARTGVVLDAGFTVGGGDISARVEAGPTLTLSGQSVAGQFVSLQGNSRLGAMSNFDPGLPRLDAGMDVILEGNFEGKFEYGLFPIAKYSVGEWNLPFDLSFDLFDINIDLNLPKIPLPSFPDLPDFGFDIPASEEDATLFRQKLPPKNPALNLAEIALDNPGKSITTTSGVDGNKATYSAKGSLIRTGLDLDGIASAAATGVSFTGTSVNIGPVGKLSYDTIDVKYGIELGVEYDASIEAVLRADLTFDNPVLMRNDDGSIETVSSYSGSWDDLPEFALLGREDVNVDVDFKNIEALFNHKASLTLSDYMELRALVMGVKVGKIPVLSLGPAYYQKFPLAGELGAFEIFDSGFSLGSLDVIDGLWDGSFTLEAAPVAEAFFVSAASRLSIPQTFIPMESKTPLASLAGRTLIVGTGDIDTQSRLDLAPLDYVDNGERTLITVSGWYGPGLNQYSNDRFSVPSLDNRVDLDQLVVPEPSRYTLAAGAIRSFDLSGIENDGHIQGNGTLSFDAAGDTLLISGSGEMRFAGPGALFGDYVRNGEGHTIVFERVDSTDRVYPGAGILPPGGQWFTFPPLSVTPGDYKPFVQNPNLAVRANHVLAMDVFENAGTITLEGASLTLDGLLRNAAGGAVNVQDNGSLNLNNSWIENAGLIHVADGSLTFNGGSGGFITGASDPAAPGRFLVGPEGRLTMTSLERLWIVEDVAVEVESGGEAIFGKQLDIDGTFSLINQAGGTVTLNGLMRRGGTATIENHGVLEILADNSLRPQPTGGPRAPVETPVVTPLDLINTGTINIRNNADFEFDVVIEDFAGDGAAFVGGTWNLLGTVGTFSNLDTGVNRDTVTAIDIRVVDVLPADLFINEVFDLDTADTALKTNYANVTMQGRSLFAYFNTIKENHGNFTIQGGHQFTTAGGYTNAAGTTLVQTGGDLFVQGALRVTGGTVQIGAGSTFTALTETETFEDGSTQDRTVEVIGGSLIVDDPSWLKNSPMFLDRPDLGEYGPGFDYIRLAAGQTWVVREQVAIDLDTGEETVTPALIDLGNTVIERSDGTIIVDGANASFDAAERMRYNHGTLTIMNGFEWNAPLNDFRNAGTMELIAASFIIDGQFRNDGDLFIDGDSYFEADVFYNGHPTQGPNASLHLDGVFNVGEFIVTQGTTVTGSATISGKLKNTGTLDIGDSPGLVETFDGYEQTADATIRFEIAGREAGVSYDQLIVHQVVGEPGGEVPPTVQTVLAGIIEIIFSEPETARGGFEWLLIDNQGEVTGTFDQVIALGLDVAPPLPLSTSGIIDDLLPRNAQDMLLGLYGDLPVYFTYLGGDGNDVSVYAVPEPAGVWLLVIAAAASAQRRRRTVRL